MKRIIVNIEDGKCNGCGACAKSCHEGAIEMVNGKARLIRDDYCDGLGDCLPVCSAGAISIMEREADPYDEVAVKEKKKKMQVDILPCGCSAFPEEVHSAFSQWPVQIKLLPANASYLSGAKLLIAADCTAYVYAGFHEQFIKGHITLVGCPKLDGVDYSEKLTEIICKNSIREVTLVRMEVPCCRGLENAVKTALQNSGKSIPWQVIEISTDGKILD